MALLKKLFGWLANRWLISILGLMLLALLIWFFAPEIAIAGTVPLQSPLSRVIAILVLVLIWSGFNIAAALRQRRQNRQVVDGLLAQPSPPPDPTAVALREEVEKLGERFREALASLREARIGTRGGRRLVYQLPWYVIIGPPGCGKTTALANSGLKFPLLDKIGGHSVRGIGGTRNCDWFFTDDAVLIDTAGRYTTQDSDEVVDRSAWQGFLELLCKHRRQRPIDGIIVAFSITDLAGRDPAERLTHARAVKRRIGEVYAGLKVRAPVYILLTKCDLVAGFVEFFGSLSAGERAEVWGTTFSLTESADPNQLVQSYAQAFSELTDRLQARVIERLEDERDVVRRGLVLSFPQQFAHLLPGLQEFLAEVVGQTRFEERLFVRGVYFTSATQEGTPIDRLISAVAASFRLERHAMPPFSGRGVSYFLTGLLQDVIFPEAGLVTATGFFGRYRRHLQWTAYGGAAVATGLLIALLATSYEGNRKLIANADASVDEFRKKTVGVATDDFTGKLSVLDDLRAFPGGYADKDKSPPAMLQFGLYQGDKIGETAESAYHRALNSLLVPKLMERLEQVIAGHLNQPEALHTLLRTYLMYTTPARRDPRQMRELAIADFNSRFPGTTNADLRDRFAGHVDALFESRIDPTPKENADLVARARQALLAMPLGARVYAQLKAQFTGGTTKPWLLSDHVSADQLRVFRWRKGGRDQGIPALFTVDGYRDAFVKNRARLVEAVLAETWVLGPDYSELKGDSERAELGRKVEELYLTDYIQQWQGLLDDLDLRPTNNTEQLADLVRTVTQPDSPIKSVLKAVTEQTRLSQTLRVAEEKRREEESTLGRVTSSVTDILGGRAPGGGGLGKTASDIFGTGSAAPTADPTARVDQHFEKLNEMVASDGAAARIDAVLQPFAELYDLLLQSQQPTADPRAVITVNQDIATRARALIARLDNVAKAQPEPVDRWLQLPLVDGRRRLVDAPSAGAKSQIQGMWGSTVAPSCRQALSGRYPFVPSSDEDVNISDFIRILGPNGEIEKFFKEQLEARVDARTTPWRWHETGGPSFSPASLRMFEQAAKIRIALFALGTPQPQFSFEIQPESLDNKARQVILELGSQQVSYQHGPLRSQRMVWPPAAGSGARIVFTPIDDPGASVGLSKSGPWAFLRLLDTAKVEPSEGRDRFRASFGVRGYKAIFQIRADSVINPFGLPELAQFRCLDRL